MLRLHRLTSVGYDFACHWLPQPLFGDPKPRKQRKKTGRLRPRARLELDRLEDRTLLSASISGNVFNDVSRSGARVAGDPGVAGQTVFLDLNNDGQFDSTNTPIAGSTKFVLGPATIGGLAATLSVQDMPAAIQDVALSLNATNTSADPIPIALFSPVGLTVSPVQQGPILFFLQPGQTFDGTFDDNATNSINQATGTTLSGTYAPEQILSNPQLYVTNEDPNGTWNLVFFPDTVHSLQLNSWSLTFKAAEPNTATDAAGNYTFANLDAGNYQVGVALTPNEGVTAPNAGHNVRSVSVAADQNFTGVDFGVTPAPDLTATAFRLSAPATAWGQSVTINYTLANQGLGDAPAFDVGLYLSSNGAINTGEPRLGTLHLDGLAAGSSTMGSVTVQLPTTPPPGFDSLAGAYVGSVIDPTNSIRESSANQSNQGAGLDLAQLGASANVAVTTGSGIQQSPSVAVDPADSKHLVAAYMDYSLLKTGYAGIGISTSIDGGATWTTDKTPIQLPAGFDQGAAAPTVVFDGQGNVYVSFMAATFLGTKPNQTNPDSSQRLDGFESNNGIFVAESSDGGTTWNTPQAVVKNTFNGSDSVPFEANPSMAIDTFQTMPDGSANPNYGNIYVTWTEFYPPGQFPGDSASTGGSFVMFAISNTGDGGTKWSTQYQTVPGTGAGTGVVSALEDPNSGNNDALPAGRGFVSFSTVTVGAGGAVYVSTNVGSYFTVYASINGGQSTNVGTAANPVWVSSFTAPNYLFYLGTPFDYANLPVSTGPTLDNFRTLATRQIVADPTRAGVLYAVTDNSLALSELGAVASTSGIVFAVSRDYGQSWTTDFTVGSEGSVAAQLTPAQLNNWLPVLNDENGGMYPPFGAAQQNQVIAGQAMPQIVVNAQGVITVIWYDTRNDPSGTNLEVWATVSTDGGKHFSANFPVSSVSFNPNDGPFTDGAGHTTYYLGDQIGLAVTDTTAYALWTDTRDGSQIIYGGSFALNPLPATPADRFAPNNTPQTATDLGKVTVQQVVPRLALSPGSADEWFSLQAGATGELKASITAANGGSNLQFQLTDANGAALSPVISNILGPTGAVIGQELVYSSVAGQTYLLHVSGQSTSGIDYTLVVSSLTADLGPQVQGTVANTLTSGGAAVYGLQMAATGTLTVTLNAGSNVTAGNLNLQIRSTDGTLLASLPTDGIAAGWSAQVRLAVSQAQVVLIVVSGNTSTAQGDYTLLFTNLDQFQSTGATLGVTVQGPDSLAAGGVNDYFFQSPVTTTATVTVTADSDVTGQLNLTAYFWDPTLSPPDYNGIPANPTGISAGQTATVSFPMNQGEANPPGVEILGLSPTAQGDYTIQISVPFQSAGPATLFFPTGGTPSSLAVADLNGDGKPDLLATNTTTSDTLSVLLGNSDGTFQAPQQSAIGPGLSFANSVEPRQIAVANLTADGAPDVIVPNLRSADVSVLLSNGNGTFQPQRRFDAVGDGEATVTGDFNGDGHADVAVLQNFAQLGAGSQVAILLGRGDGTFQPPVLYKTALTQGAGAMVVGDFAGNGKLDLIVFSYNSAFAQIFTGNGDGKFRDGGTFFAGENTYSAAAVDLNGDGKLDLVTTGTNSGKVYVLLGNGNGTFQTPTAFQVMTPGPGDNVGVHGLVVVDFGNAAAPGTPDGHLDIVVTAEARSGAGGAQVIMLPGLVDSHGQYAGFGAPVVLAHVGAPGDIVAGDFLGNKATDLAVADKGGITVIYAKPPTLTANSTPATARDLGTVTHLVTLSQSIVSSQEDAYYTLKVPADAAPGSGDQVIDFAARVQNVGGSGISMEVLDTNGAVLGSGTRFRVSAAQGAVLTVHVFGVKGGERVQGSGSYVLDIDVLPQVVSVQAQSVLPGAPATSLVITLQGDHLDPAAAQNPANYTVTWLGPNGPQVIPVSAVAGSQPITYNPGADVQVDSGLSYPTAARQTITLLFANPLPAGAYQITLSPAIQSAAVVANESDLLAGNNGLAGHPLVTRTKANDGTITVTNGDTLIVTDLVSQAGMGNPDGIGSGTSFLTQLGNDLGALLDALLAQKGDDPSISQAINDQILARFLPGYTPTAGPQSFAIFWLDPVAIGLQTPQQGQQVSYNLQSNTAANTASQTYISVGGNVEVIVVAGISGTFNLSVANVPETARGGAVVIAPGGAEAVTFTDGLRTGQTSFEVKVAKANTAEGEGNGNGSGQGNGNGSGPGQGNGNGNGLGQGNGNGNGPGQGNTGNGPGQGNGSSNGPGTTPPNGNPSPSPQTVTSTAPAETATASAANPSSTGNSFSNTLAELVSEGQISSIVNGTTGESAAVAGTSFVSTGTAGNGATTGPGTAAANGGSSEDALTKLLAAVENSIDEVFLRWRDATDSLLDATRPAVDGAADTVEKAASPAGSLLEAVGGKALTRAGLTWRDMIKVLATSTEAVAEDFVKQLPLPHLKGAKATPPTAQPPAPEEEEQEESLWEQDFSENSLGEQMMWEGKEAGLALLVVSGAYHAWLRDHEEEEKELVESAEE